MLKNNFLFIGFILLLICSCKKDTKTAEPDPVVDNTGKGNLQLQFLPKSNLSDLIFNQNYINQKGDTFTVTKFNYFISSIILTKEDNTTFSEANSYHLIHHDSGRSFSLNLSDVPVGNYKSISLTIGVDSARNVSGVQSGDLDPAVSSDMFWSWNSGYIFLKLEGSSPKSGSSNKKFEYHIGGFGGVNKAQRALSINFNSQVSSVNASATSIIYLNANVNEIFANPSIIDLSKQYNILSAGVNAKLIADNYVDLFSLNKIENK